MRWLLWKDYRHNRVVVIAGLCFLLVPHLIGAYATFRGDPKGSPLESRWRANLAISCLYSIFASQVAIALIGGNAIAGERSDHSAEFLFSLPISRTRLLISKLWLSLAIAGVIWLANAPILAYVARSSFLFRRDIPDVAELLINTAITGLVFFSVAWLLSSLISSPAMAVCGGLIAPALIGLGFTFLDYLSIVSIPHSLFEPLYRTICLAIAPPCFVVGTWYYLRRVEP
jgi:ABC-type transport system involved in multi-copper enzyme maturation permease subunit